MNLDFWGHSLIDNAHFQWVGEAMPNPMEARLQFVTEWQAVKSEDVYRRIIADDGEGMIADEVWEFLTRLGAVERLLEQSMKILAWALRVQP